MDKTILEAVSGLSNQDGVVFIKPEMVGRPVLNEMLAAIFDNYSATVIWTQTAAPSLIEAALRAGFAATTPLDDRPVLVMTPFRFRRPITVEA